ncbi:putative calcineurin-like phosphoesterase domain, ApaH type, metallo-dependent phosphatase [Helianthus anomalus]
MKTDIGIFQEGLHHGPLCHLILRCRRNNLNSNIMKSVGFWVNIGETFDSNQTLTYYESNPIKGQTVLFVGDLSYADKYPLHDNNRWDTWGKFVERNVAYQPWIWSVGNHKIDFLPKYGESEPFKPYTHRYFVPYEASGSTCCHFI